MSLGTRMSNYEGADLFQVIMTANHVGIVVVCLFDFVKLLRLVGCIKESFSKYDRNSRIPVAVHD